MTSFTLKSTRFAFPALLALSLIFTAIACQEKAPEILQEETVASKTATSKLPAHLNAFAFDLYHEIRKEEDGNIFFSPFSISSALGMTYAGAKGNTASEMAKALHFPEDHLKLHPNLKAVVEGVEERGKATGCEMAVANALWGQQGYEFIPDFKSLIKKYYGGGFQEVDFIEEAAREEARLKINGWVEEKTRDKIKDLIPEGILNDKSRLVLTNAIYFKGTWSSEFKEEATRPAPFYSPQGEIEAPLMSQEAAFGFMQDETVQMLEMTYGEISKSDSGDTTSRLSMLVMLPVDKAGLEALENSLTLEGLNDRILRMRKGKVRVYFPKYEMTLDLTLNKMLKDMGMPKAFSNDAEFFGISDPNKEIPLKISAVLHKAFVEVNEEGTEAAAATAVIMMQVTSVRPPPPPPPVFRADHPFLFFIRDMETGTILFMGRVTDPT